jgi:hypothetical protein
MHATDVFRKYTIIMQIIYEATSISSRFFSRKELKNYVTQLYPTPVKSSSVCCFYSTCTYQIGENELKTSIIAPGKNIQGFGGPSEFLFKTKSNLITPMIV